MQTFTSNTPQETEFIAARFAQTLKGGEVIAFHGDLGMGKTCFIRGLAGGLGYMGEVTSPTFALINEYRGGRLDLFHFDMYRIESWEDLYSTGYFDYITYGGVVAIEWSENIEAALSENTIYVTLEQIDDTKRVITICGDENE